MIFPKIVTYQTSEYDEMVLLRHKILREPLGLSFSKEDLEKDEHDFLLALFIPQTHKLVACCILTPIDDKTVKLRQMAVDETVQKAGVGTAMLSFAEYVAIKENFERIELNAREVAMGFYKKYDYEVVGGKFTEVGLPHYKMEKRLNNR